MLTLTENATSAIAHLTQQIPADTAGLRIATAENPEQGYAVSLTDGPQEGDAVVEDAGARVYVDPIASAQLDDRVLDAQLSDDGSVGFALAQRR